MAARVSAASAVLGPTAKTGPRLLYGPTARPHTGCRQVRGMPAVEPRGACKPTSTNATLLHACSNDVLYAGDPSYAEQLGELCGSVLAAIEVELGTLDTAAKAGDAQAKASLMLVLPQLLPLLPPILGIAPSLLPSVEAVCLRLKGLGKKCTTPPYY